MARLRMDGVSSDALVPTPPAGKATIFYNSTDRIYKVKLDDGSVAPIGSGGGGGGTWGSITGTLSSQTDLQNALDAKYDASNPDAFVDAAGAASAAPVQSVAGKTGIVTLSSSDVGLGNVDNTSDANKPISTATQLALNDKYDASNPDSFVDAAGAASAAPVQSVAGQTGAVVLSKSDVGLSDVDNTSDANKPVSTATQLALNDKYDASNPDNFVDAAGAASAAPVQSVAGKTGTVTLSSADVGLGNVDNTSDANKPVSTATQLALNDKYDASNPANYVDAIGASAAAPVQSVAGKTGTVTLAASDVGLGNVDNTSDLNKPISTATSTALSGKLSLSGGTMSGALNMGSNLISSVTDPVSAQDAATKNYVDTGLAVSQVRYVSKNGSDSTGNGSINKPFLTIAAAMNSITDSSPTNRYAIFVASGNYTETGILYLKPNVFVCGLAKESVRISATSFQMHSSFSANSGSDNRSGFYRVSLLNACDFNWNTVQSAAGKLYFNEVSFSSTINLYGYNNAIAQAQFDSCLLFGALTISGINVGVFTNNVCYGNITLTQHPNGGMATILNAAGGYCAGTYSATTTVTDFNRRCAAFARSFYMGTVTLNGASVYLDYTVDSLPAAGASISNGANLVAMNAGGGANTALSNLVYPTAVNSPIMPATSGATNFGDWGKQWAWSFGYVHASSGSDCYLISYPSAYAADSTGRNIGIYPDGAGLQANVNGGQIDMETAAVSGTGVRGNIRMNARNIDHTQSPSVNFVLENGVTGSRPASPVVGQMYFDTTLKKPIWYSATGWVDAAGTAV